MLAGKPAHAFAYLRLLRPGDVVDDIDVARRQELRRRFGPGRERRQKLGQKKNNNRQAALVAHGAPFVPQSIAAAPTDPKDMLQRDNMRSGLPVRRTSYLIGSKPAAAAPVTQPAASYRFAVGGSGLA